MFAVIRTTTEKLEDTVNAHTSPGRSYRELQWVGGRDWILVVELADEAPETRALTATVLRAREELGFYGASLAQRFPGEKVHEPITSIMAILDAAMQYATQGHTVGWVQDDDRRHHRFDADEFYGPSMPVDTNPSSFTGLIDPEVEWGDIKYGRYSQTRLPEGYEFTGWIEDAARSWIIFLGPHGAPALYWPRRDREGGVIGAPIKL